jgi:hypothetical protein
VERLVDGHMESIVKIKRKVNDLVSARPKREIAHIILVIKNNRSQRGRGRFG